MLVLSQLSLKGRALRALSGREHSRVELERKLIAHESQPGELAQILDELTAKGFISEARVAQSVIHRRAAKLGTARVVQEMRAKGLGNEEVAQATEQLKATEFERAREADATGLGAGVEFLVVLARQPFQTQGGDAAR